MPCLWMPFPLIMKKNIYINILFFFPLFFLQCEKKPLLDQLVLPSDSALHDADRYALITSRYVVLQDSPEEPAIAVGYARRKDIFEVKGITISKKNGEYVLWVNIGVGWLPRDTVRLYSSEAKARTAAKNAQL